VNRLTVAPVYFTPGASRSWCDPASESPAQVRSSVRLVASVAWPLSTVVAKRTHDCMGRGIQPGKVIYRSRTACFYSPEGKCAAPLYEVLSLPGSKATRLPREAGNRTTRVLPYPDDSCVTDTRQQSAAPVESKSSYPVFAAHHLSASGGGHSGSEAVDDPSPRSGRSLSRLM
jgi:hypothetical protein